MLVKLSEGFNEGDAPRERLVAGLRRLVGYMIRYGKRPTRFRRPASVSAA